MESVSEVGQGAAHEAAVRMFGFSTDTYREHERVDAWREVFGRTLLNLEFLPSLDENFRANATIFRSPGLKTIHASATVANQNNARSLITNDDVSLVWIKSLRAHATQLGRSGGLASGDAVLMSHQDVGGIAFQDGSRYEALCVPRATLTPLVRDLGALFARPVPASDPAQRMLRRHLQHAQEDLVAGGPDLRAAFIDHISDLLALTLGATGDAAHSARARGLPAARLRAIQDEIRKTCHHPELSVHSVAARHGVSERYVQRIFEQSGVTFTQYLTEQRLLAAYKALRRQAAVPISTVAYDCGFSDISHFNRVFRRRFGCAPSELRKAPPAED